MSLEKIENRIYRRMAQASKEFGLIEPNDRIMVCLSGGKDSWVMLHMLRKMQSVVPFKFSIIGVNLDQGHPGFPQHVISDYLEAEGYEFKMLSVDTHSVVTEKIPEGKTFCSLCSRLRRGILYNAAVELGCTKMALGHHRDDIIETAMLNLLYAGKLGTMPPKLRSNDGRNVVIRPLALCKEEDIAIYATAMEFPIVPCNLCGSQDGLHRQKVKRLIAQLNEENPRIKGNMMAALANVQPTHLLDLSLQRSLGVDIVDTKDPWIDGDQPN